MKTEIISWRWRWGTAGLVGFICGCFMAADWLEEGVAAKVALFGGLFAWVESATVVWMGLTMIDAWLWWRWYKPFSRHNEGCICKRCQWIRRIP